MYRNLVEPYFDYCSTVWMNCNKTLRNRLQALQNRAGELIAGADKFDKPSELLQNLAILELENRRKIHSAILIYKCLNGLAPKCLSELFSKKSNTCHYDLRGIDNSLALPKPETEFLNRSFRYSGAELWNTIPAENIQASASLGEFKTQIKNNFSTTL